MPLVQYSRDDSCYSRIATRRRLLLLFNRLLNRQACVFGAADLLNPSGRLGRQPFVLLMMHSSSSIRQCPTDVFTPRAAIDSRFSNRFMNRVGLV